MLEKTKNYEEVFWINQHYGKKSIDGFDENKIYEAENRLKRFAPLIEKLFPETKSTDGIIESTLKEIPQMKINLEKKFGTNIFGKLFLKMDSHLPISGSVKARGGIHEVLEHAENLALENGLIKNLEDDYTKLVTDDAKSFFSKYKIQVGSTGNLGLSIGIMGAALGFETIVHMSRDAKQWKKDLLRKKGANVIEYSGDYGLAVKNGREQSDKDSHSYFIDDEKSQSLFSGYAVAALRLKNQFAEKNIVVNKENPLFVYIPCGVGGAPGGIIFGLHKLFGENVHCFLIEPTHAPCMLLGLESGLYNQVSVQDFGLDGKTAADGLAVGRCSAFVGKLIQPIVRGESTVDDSNLFQYQKLLWTQEKIYIEPSSCAAFHGLKSENLYIKKMNLNIKNANHIVWATGGNMVPKEIQDLELGLS